MKSIIRAGKLVALSAILAGCGLQVQPSAPAPTPTISPNTEALDPFSPPGSEVLNGQEATYQTTWTIKDVQTHKTPQDCWMAYEDKVYDVTAYPESSGNQGSNAIYKTCGKDTTGNLDQIFNGTSLNSSEVKSGLPNFFIGNLRP